MKQIVETKKPTICLSLLAETGEAGRNELQQLEALPFEIVEWRIDGLKENLLNKDYVLENYMLLKEVTKKPIFITLRTKNQGGKKEMTRKEYFFFMESLLALEKLDGIDIEYEKGWGKSLSFLIEKCKRKNVFTILSYHDFAKTPEEIEIREKIREMEALGADLPKAAYMPKNVEDVERTISVIMEIEKEGFPFTLISMGEIGQDTRIKHGAMTFARGKKETAKGQKSVEDVYGLICEEWGTSV